MASFPEQTEAGGFLHPSLPSPPISPITPILPRPRPQPLRPGSAKEDNLINYLDQQLMEISGRHENRHRFRQVEGGQGRYQSFKAVAVDLERVVDILWVSGTPSLQIPYLLNIALAVSTYLPSFDFSPPETFRLLHKLDIAFSSLLHGRNVETGENLPGFEGGRGGLSTTEKVRVRGLVERTRIAVVGVAGKGEASSISSLSTDDEGDTRRADDSGLEEDGNVDSSHEQWEMEVARVYESTIVDLGAALDANSVGFA